MTYSLMERLLKQSLGRDQSQQSWRNSKVLS